MKYFLFLFLILSGLALEAQDKKAKKILDKLNEEYTAASTVTIDFTLTIQFPEEDPRVYDSHVIQSGKKFVFKNEEYEYYGDGESVWIYEHSKNEIQINDFEEDEADDYFITPLDLLSQYKSGKFEYKIVDERRRTVDIEFKPDDEFSDYSKFRITINPDTNEIIFIKAFGKDSSRLIIEIDQVAYNKNYVLSIFEFDVKKYPNAHIEDLRF